MFANPLIIHFAVFASVSATTAWLIVLLRRSGSQVQARLNELSGEGPSAIRVEGASSLTRPTAAKSHPTRFWTGLVLTNESQRNEHRLRLIRVGVYAPYAANVLSAVRLTLLIAPLLLGLTAFHLRLLPLNLVMMVAAPTGALGLILPGLWLKSRSSKRQGTLRRSLPDFLDLIVVCLESGMSFESALQRTTEELRAAHPLLASELAIVQREIAVGRNVADALRNFAERVDMEVVRLLATNVQQARRLGIRMAESLRIHADLLRTQREQRAEELAQKAAVKILFPTLLFIFPAIFVVLVGPAVFEISAMFQDDSPVVEMEQRQPPRTPDPHSGR